MSELKCKFLIVDDSEDDQFLLDRRLHRVFPKCAIVGSLDDGEAAIAYLSGRGVFSDRELFPFPDVMFLDVRMPGKDGLEVLRWIKEQSLQNLCVVVLTSANSASEADEAIQLGAHVHLSKQRMSDSSAAELRQIVEKACSEVERAEVGTSELIDGLMR